MLPEHLELPPSAKRHRCIVPHDDGLGNAGRWDASFFRASFFWRFVMSWGDLIVFVGGYFAWRFWQKRKVKADAEEEEEMQV